MPWVHGKTIYMSRIVGNLTRLAIQRAANEGEIVRKLNLLFSNKIILFFFILCYRSVRCIVVVLDAVASDSFFPYSGG